MSEQRVDWNGFVILAKEMVDPEWKLIKEMVDVFVQSTQEKLDELKQHINAKNREGVRSVAHFMKSSSATLGINRFADLCKTLEMKARYKTGEIEWSDYEMLNDEYQAAIEELQHLDEHRQAHSS